jgi:hypothetical protein
MEIPHQGRESLLVTIKEAASHPIFVHVVMDIQDSIVEHQSAVIGKLMGMW